MLIKKILLAMGLVGLGFVLGGLVVLKYYERPAIVRTSNTMHFCSCVWDNPAYTNMMQIADNETNQLIKSKTKDFLRAHGLLDGDFTACLVPTGNGNFNLNIWTSNRNTRVWNLQDSYNKLVEGCLSPHWAMIDEAHEGSKEPLRHRQANPSAPCWGPLLDLSKIYDWQAFDDIFSGDDPPCDGQRLGNAPQP